MGQYTPYIFDNSTGTGVLAVSFDPNVNFILVAVKLHLSTAGDASDTFTITADSTEGAAYDILLLSQSMSAETDVLWTPDLLPFKKDDKLLFGMTRASGVTWGLEIVYREEA